MSTDLHCHVLPGIDDGPRSIEESVDLARAYLAAGIERVAATPHVNLRWGDDEIKIATALERLRLVLAERQVDLRVESGAEVALSTAVELSPEQLSNHRLAGGEWLLVEPPTRGPSLSVHSMIFAIQSQGHRVLLAHPERSEIFQDDLDLLASLVRGGIRTQVTATALTGSFGTRAQRTAHQMFKRNLVHVIASDAHHATDRPPGMNEHLKRSGHGELIQWLCHDMPAWILDGGEEPDRPDYAGSGETPEGGGLLRRLGLRR